MSQKIARHSILLDPPAFLASAAAVAGPKEGLGPLAGSYDQVYADILIRQKSFEAAERKMLGDACALALQKGKYKTEDMDFFLAGDLLNQITASGYTAASLALPFFGLYGACSTLALSLGLGAALISAGMAVNVLAATSSHNSSSERQFRYPTEYGFQRPLVSQWTVTGAGGAVISAQAANAPRITALTFGKVIDLNQKDSMGLGLAMAPAAAATLVAHFTELQRSPSYYDLIITGDLGKIGMNINSMLMARAGYPLQDNYNDCGAMIYNPDIQQVNAGGSGCAASALVFLGNIWSRMQKGDLQKVLLVCTGALHSPTTAAQGESIPCIAHAVAIEQ